MFTLYTRESTWYARAERFVGETLLAAAGLPTPAEVVYLDEWTPSEATALWLAWLFHNGSREERAAAAGLMPVVATLLIEGCVSDYWSNTHGIATHAMHQRVGRTKLVP